MQYDRRMMLDWFCERKKDVLTEGHHARVRGVRHLSSIIEFEINGGYWVESEGAMKSLVVKRSIVIAGHKTSVSLEDAFWTGLKDIAASRHLTLSDMITTIDATRVGGNLSSAIRLFVLDHYQA